MKTMRKLISVLLVAVMVLSLGVTAMAAGADGSITIENATIGQTYTAYRLFDATYNASGATAYTIDTNKTSFYTALNAPFTFTESVVSGKSNVTLAEDKTDADVLNFLKDVNTKSGFENAVMEKLAVETANASTVTWQNITHGYYVVTSSLNGGAAVTVDNATPNATIKDKNQKPSFGDNGGKTINDAVETTADIGDTIPYQVAFSATNYNGEKKIVKYTVKDELAEGLSYVMDGDKVNATVTVDGTLIDTALTTITMGTNNRSFQLDITWYEDDAFKYPNSPSNVVVTYSATVDSDCAMNAALVNKATFTYTDEGGTETTDTTQTDEASVYTYALAIKKVDDSNNPLSGAKFNIKRGEETLKFTETATKGVYVYDATNGSTEVVSPASGEIVLKGVKAETYTVVETEAPAGYNLLTEEKSVTAVKDSATVTKVSYDNNGNIVSEETGAAATIPVEEITIVNAAGSTLPSTGGMGTTIFYIVGAVLVLGAGVVLVSKKRMRTGD